jgi:hypothetical protein
MLAYQQVYYTTSTMRKERLPKDQLKRLLIDHSILEGIHEGRYTEVIEHDDTAKKIPNGRSLIISYYDGERYICTKHELRTSRGDTRHQDVEEVLMGDTLYLKEQAEYEPP